MMPSRPASIRRIVHNFLLREEARPKAGKAQGRRNRAQENTGKEIQVSELNDKKAALLDRLMDYFYPCDGGIAWIQEETRFGLTDANAIQLERDLMEVYLRFSEEHC
jgi:hypothetical protein